MSVNQLDRTRGYDWSPLFKSKVIAIFQVNGLVGVPASVTTFDQRRSVECPQAGEQSQRQSGTFAETERPSILDRFEYGRWTFYDCNFVVHTKNNTINISPQT